MKLESKFDPEIVIKMFIQSLMSYSTWTRCIFWLISCFNDRSSQVFDCLKFLLYGIITNVVMSSLTSFKKCRPLHPHLLKVPVLSEKHHEVNVLGERECSSGCPEQPPVDPCVSAALNVSLSQS